jgi:hypothetical protein
MKVKFERVLDGLNRYIDSEIYCNLNDFQEFMARIVVGRVNSSADNIKNILMSNGFAKTLCIIDSDGMVDIDKLMQEIRHEIERKGSVEFTVPMFGKMKFTAADVDLLHNMIVRD